MPKFNVGDEVERTKVRNTDCDYRNNHIGKVTEVKGVLIRVDGLQWSSEDCWELLRRTKDQAIKLLTSLGYTVIEPPKPLSGKIQVFMTPSGNVHAIPLERKHETSLTITRVLVIVDWTEGDGI